VAAGPLDHLVAIALCEIGSLCSKSDAWASPFEWVEWRGKATHSPGCGMSRTQFAFRL